MAPGDIHWLRGQTNTFPGSGSVGIGTLSPAAPLDIAGQSYKLSDTIAVKEFHANFPNSQANQKIDFYMAGTQSFAGIIDVDVTDYWAWQNAFGVITKRFYLGMAPNNAVYMNQSRVLDEGGATADNYALSDLIWDGTQYKITLVHRTSNGNAPTVRFTAYTSHWGGYGLTHIGNFLSFTMGSVYTTDSTQYDRPYVYFNNRVGIGTSKPQATLNIQDPSSAALRIDTTDAVSNSQVRFYRGGTYMGGVLKNNADSIQLINGAQAGLTILQSNGYVGIGTAAPQSALAVNGTITTKEVVVTATGWADYVFAPEYRPAPLSEVASYIQENHHLPGIPSAKEVEEKGVSVGAMQSKLLAKIEELTLHMIDLERENRDFQLETKELGELRQRIVRLEAGGDRHD